MQQPLLSDAAQAGDAAVKTSRPLIIAVAHQKGGVSKTTTTCNLAVGLAARLGPGAVAVVDLDPQGSATQHLGGDPMAARGGTYDLLTGRRSLGDLLRPTAAGEVMLVPGEARMTLAEVDPALRDLSHVRMRRLLTDAPDTLTCIILDCPPGFGVFTTVGVMAADLVLVPTPPVPFSQAALDNAVQFIGGLRADGRDRLALLITMMHPDDPVQAECAEHLRRAWHDQVFSVAIPYDPVAEQAVAAGRPALLYAPSSAIARAYQKAADELFGGIATVLPGALPAGASAGSEAGSPPAAPPIVQSAQIQPENGQPENGQPEPGTEPPLPPEQPGDWSNFVRSINQSPSAEFPTRSIWPRLMAVLLVVVLFGAAIVVALISGAASRLPAPFSDWAAAGQTALLDLIASLGGVL